MKNRFALVGVLVIVAVVVGYLVWAYASHLDYLSKTVRETDRWVIIRDLNGDIMAVETIDDDLWNTLGNLHQNQTAMWIGGIVEEYDNKWGFRFNPETIVVAQITIEGAQSTIQGISDDLNYWMNIWTKETYVMAKVTELHE
jgi:hypothetical protein